MKRSNPWQWAVWPLVAAAIVMGAGRMLGANGNDQPLETGPDVVILRELEDVYAPVPFDHLGHAKMAQMWHGCETCHHRSPNPTLGLDGATTMSLAAERNQANASEIPSCKSCHSKTADETDIRMPGLKGAYHRQCLNCHKEWMHENACVICHEPKVKGVVELYDRSPDDIVGRMHPPIPEPENVAYKTRFTPADGGNVLFRHQGHTVDFGLRCVECHHEDNCSHCHGPKGDTSAQKPLRPGMTWEASHGPCMACHVDDRCQHCHYKNDAPPPPPFDHVITGQLLDRDHAGLACAACHVGFPFAAAPSCGDAKCHPSETIEYPARLPGPLALPEPEAGEDETDTPSEAPSEVPKEEVAP